ncbi:MAG: D-alanyl-D-alanine carboxypeptidase/D-alanyl-D-alanine endopeptidase [Acidimicrobiales bacterium]
MRRQLHLAVLALISLACGVAAVRLGPPSEAGPAPPAGATDAPVLSLRRAPSVVARAVGDRRLEAALDQVWSASPPSSCLLVTEAGRVVYERQPDQAVVPASTLKLLTATAVLDRLEPAARLRTTVLGPPLGAGGVVDGDLWLVGGGDPVLGTRPWADHFTRQPALFTPLETLADRVVGAGVREVRGRVVGDDGRYDQRRYVASWPPRYMAEHQTGPLSALSVNDGFAAWDPEDVPFEDPAAGAAGALIDLLASRGVVVAGGPAAGPRPEGLDVVAAIDSPTIAELVGQMLQESDNGTAELLLKELGRQVGGGGTTAAGAAAVTEAVADVVGGAGGATVVDGSGLDSGNRVTCRLLHAVLSRAPEGDALDSGLAVAGHSGTLTKRFLGTLARGRLRAKTGSIMGVAALAGYARTESGSELIFSYVVNGIGRSAQAVPLQDDLGAGLVEYPARVDVAALGPAGYAPAA